MPFLEVGVKKCEEVFPYALCSISHFAVVVHLRAHITLGQLFLAAVFVELENLRGMEILRHFESEIAEQLDVLGKAREPVLSADNVSRFHEVVVDCMGKVVCRNAVGFEKHEVLVVFRNFKVSFDKVGEFRLLLRVAVC